MEHSMELAQSILHIVLGYFQAGFYHVNGVQGLLIAGVLAYSMPTWQRLPSTAVVAVIAQVILGVMLPVLANGSALKLPPLVEVGYWKYLAELFAGYLLVVALFFFVKSLVLGGSGGHSHSHGH